MPAGARFFNVVPLLVFCYFVPAAPLERGRHPARVGALRLHPARPAAGQPAPAGALDRHPGRDLALAGTRSCSSWPARPASRSAGRSRSWRSAGCSPTETLDQAWRGLAALCGSWIGGSANFVAVGESVGRDAATLSLMVVVDVACRERVDGGAALVRRPREADGRADRRRPRRASTPCARRWSATRPRSPAGQRRRDADDPRARHRQHGRRDLGRRLPSGHRHHRQRLHLGGLPRSPPWAWSLSFTPLRRLEGAGASVMGSVFLYLLVTTIGASAQFARVLDNLPLLAVGALWMLIHAAVMLAVRRFLRARSSSWPSARRRTSAGPPRRRSWRRPSIPRSLPSACCWPCSVTCSARTWAC